VRISNLQMAKGLRSSTKKANKARLRTAIFEPVEDSRRERLSQKLLELASKPSPHAEVDILMEEANKGWA
jgi:hypothetical protein